jgi:hypothetical protein
MGFWNGLVKMAQGKPLFEAPGEPSDDGQPAAARADAPTTTAVNDAGYKIVPEVSLEHCESHLSGDQMDVTVWVTNRSSVPIELDKVVMLGLTTELDRILAPSEARELRFYRGKVPTSDDYHTANLYYKQRSSGDYFCADFTIEYDYDSQGFYEVEELHPVHPVRDV